MTLIEQQLRRLVLWLIARLHRLVYVCDCPAESSVAMIMLILMMVKMQIKTMPMTTMGDGGRDNRCE